MMIEFRGKMSKTCKRRILEKNYKGGLIAGFITVAIFLGPLVYLALYWQVAIWLAVAALVMLPFFVGIPPTKKDIGLLIPSSISIDINEQVIVWKSDKMETIKDFDEVKYITDAQDCYVFKFCYVARDMRFVCEKNLLCQGTIQEFEKVFEDRLRKK